MSIFVVCDKGLFHLEGLLTKSPAEMVEILFTICYNDLQKKL